jgi:hypothetical protein
VPVIVKPGFADGNHAWVARQIDEFVDRRFAYMGCLGMDANRSQNRRPGLGKRQHARQFFKVDGNTDGAAHAIVVHQVEHLIDPRGQLGEVEVTVGIDQHHGAIRRYASDGRTASRHPAALRCADALRRHFRHS